MYFFYFSLAVCFGAKMREKEKDKGGNNPINLKLLSVRSFINPTKT
jgi:hypothetical protein